MPTDVPQNHVFRSSEFVGIIKNAIDFFKNTPICDLPPTINFGGSGIYALYYQGDFPLYAKLVQKNGTNYDIPIYVGKAVPSGWRTNRVLSTSNTVLKNRLREHAGTIQQSKNLNLADFKCRFVILHGVESDLIGAFESGLIRHYSPLWNSVVDGFGNHDPGAGRYNQARSEWDVLHPGRVFAERLTGEKPNEERIKKEISSYFDQSSLF